LSWKDSSNILTSVAFISWPKLQQQCPSAPSPQRFERSSTLRSATWSVPDRSQFPSLQAALWGSEDTQMLYHEALHIFYKINTFFLDYTTNWAFKDGLNTTTIRSIQNLSILLLWVRFREPRLFHHLILQQVRNLRNWFYLLYIHLPLEGARIEAHYFECSKEPDTAMAEWEGRHCLSSSGSIPSLLSTYGKVSSGLH